MDLNSVTMLLISGLYRLVCVCVGGGAFGPSPSRLRICLFRYCGCELICTRLSLSATFRLHLRQHSFEHSHLRTHRDEPSFLLADSFARCS